MDEAEGYNYEENTPIWFDPNPKVQVSEFKNWKDYISVYQANFIQTKQDRDLLKNKFEEVTNIRKSDSLFLRKLIRFIQDDIRYLGLENGIFSHQPHPPYQVLQQRFGDCKDKSFLLSELLKAYGYQAQPVLVSSYKGKNLLENLPSSNSFDHCVVRFKENNKDEYAYIDPTLTLQGGSVKETFFPDYQYGLVINDSTQNLIKLPEPEISRIKIKEVFNLNNFNSGAFLEVVTTYEGAYADYRRSLFEQIDLDELQKDYTNFYRNLYPNIEPDITLKIEDYRNKNILITKEFYKIDKVWFPNPTNKTYLNAEFYPISLEGYMSTIGSSKRKTPYYVDPVELEYNQIINSSYPFDIEDTSSEIEGNGYSFSQNLESKDDGYQINVSYNYSNSNRFIPVKDVKDYFQDHQKMLENLNLTITADPTLTYNPNKRVGSWKATLISFFTIIISTILCIKIHRKYNIDVKIEEQWQKKINGWLILIGILLFLSPITLFYEIITAGYFEKHTWAEVFSENNSILRGILFTSNLFIYWFLIVFNIMLIVQFFKRRSTFPRLYAFFLAFTFILACTNSLSGIAFSSNHLQPYETQEIYVWLGISFVFKLSIISFILFTEKSKDTFTKTFYSKKMKNEEKLNELSNSANLN